MRMLHQIIGMSRSRRLYLPSETMLRKLSSLALNRMLSGSRGCVGSLVVLLIEEDASRGDQGRLVGLTMIKAGAIRSSSSIRLLVSMFTARDESASLIQLSHICGAMETDF